MRLNCSVKSAADMASALLSKLRDKGCADRGVVHVLVLLGYVKGIKSWPSVSYGSIDVLDTSVLPVLFDDFQVHDFRHEIGLDKLQGGPIS